MIRSGSDSRERAVVGLDPWRGGCEGSPIASTYISDFGQGGLTVESISKNSVKATRRNRDTTGHC